MTKKYFHNFNGLRFYFASYIAIIHIEEIKAALGLPALYPKYKFLEVIGISAITLFFVMSGFLISYFLLNEKIKNTDSTIDIKKFYKSRVLRIWPLYFLCMIIYWILLPNSFMHELYDKIYFVKFYPVLQEIQFSKAMYFTLFMFFLPQLAGAIAHVYGGMVLYAGHFWSIGSEELFYLLWPILLYKFKSYKKIFIVGFAFIYSWYILLIIMFIINRLFIKDPQLTSILLTATAFLALTRLYCMLIGGLFAYLYIKKHPFLNFVRKKSVVIISLIILAIMGLNAIDFPFLIHEIYALLWSILIIHFVKDDVKYGWLNSKFVSYMGTISYGIYMYHNFVIIVVIYIALYFGIKNIILFNVFVHVLTLVFTYLISHISYQYFEVKFLKLKK